MIPVARATRMPLNLRAESEPDAHRAIPFDYTFRFNLVGQPDLVQRSIVTISIEASFTAVSIGYGVVPQVTPIVFGPEPPPPGTILLAGGLPRLRDITIGSLLDALDDALANTPDAIGGETGVEASFKGGFRLNPRFAELALLNDGGNSIRDSETLRSLFQVVSAPSDEVQFLYALFDEGSGREFQSEPLLNTAGLGISNGDRPFRYFARPITFAPLSTIRMEVTEKSDFQGELHVSLHGYKVLGSPGTPTGRGQTPVRRRR
jgi:hypothetical protein